MAEKVTYLNHENLLLSQRICWLYFFWLIVLLLVPHFLINFFCYVKTFVTRVLKDALFIKIIPLSCGAKVKGVSHVSHMLCAVGSSHLIFHQPGYTQTPVITPFVRVWLALCKGCIKGLSRQCLTGVSSFIVLLMYTQTHTCTHPVGHSSVWQQLLVVQ